jgi:hypothetical protein
MKWQYVELLIYNCMYRFPSGAAEKKLWINLLQLNMPCNRAIVQPWFVRITFPPARSTLRRRTEC